jgi:hypothetical protein
MRTSIRLATAVTALLGLLLAGCADPTDRPASEASSATLATSGSAPQSMTAAETRWIDAVEQLLPAMNKVFTDSPPNMTPTALTALATAASGCRRELARIGPASARLQPVQALVEQACHEYDQGAACFTAAARVGIPSSTAELSTVERQMKCGFAVAATGGGRLAEAQVKAAEISNGVAAP